MARVPVQWVLSILFLSSIGGCTLIAPPGGDAGETNSSKLIPFSSETELASYLSGEMSARSAMFDRSGGMGGEFMFGDAPVGAPAPGAGLDAADGSLAAQDDTNGFSGTTLQEVGVDEADVVKTDGDYLYLMDNEHGGASLLRIVSVGAATRMSVVSEIELTGYGEQLYLYDGKVIALTSDAGFYGYPGVIEPVPVDFDFVEGGIPVPVEADMMDLDSGRMEGETTVAVDVSPGGVVSGPADGMMGGMMDGVIDTIAPEIQFHRPRTVVTVVDVSAPDSPVVLSTTAFDGAQSSSRMIDGVLHLVVSNFESFFLDVFPSMGRPDFDAAVTDTAVVLPTYTHVDADGRETSGNVVTWDRMYRPTDPDGFGVVTVISMDLDRDASFSAVGIAAEPGMVYSSRDALYLTDTEYHFSGMHRETTDVYKFAYIGRGVVPAGTGTVPGRILNQYSMGEHEGALRVASTIGARFGFFGPVEPSSNAVYVLRESDETLELVGSVDGIAPGERLQSARFVGNRGYVVTFEEIDPLFTLDLSDATNPRVVGELEVPGFSTFIVPIDEGHLLTVGQHVPPPGEFGPWGVQVSIFDVTDFANPRRSSHMVFGEDTGAYSEAIHNPKAFTYYAERGLVALPLSIYDDRVFFEGEIDADFDDVGSPDLAVGANATDGGGSSGSSGAIAVGGPVVADEPPVDSSLPVEPSIPFVPGGFEGLVVLSASAEGGLTELGRISTRYPDAGIYWLSYTRGVFIDDDVCAVTNRAVRRAQTSNVGAVVGELVFE